jgi:hypothetical protein
MFIIRCVHQLYQRAALEPAVTAAAVDDAAVAVRVYDPVVASSSSSSLPSRGRRPSAVRRNLLVPHALNPDFGGVGEGLLQIGGGWLRWNVGSSMLLENVRQLLHDVAPYACQ